MKKIWSAVTGYVRETDKWLIAMCLLASGLSLLFLWGTYHSGLSLESKLFSQGVSIGVGFVAAIVISKLDYLTLLKLWKLYVPLCAGLVLLTLTSLGWARGSDQAWLRIPLGGSYYSLQPSELLKICFITTFSLHIDKIKDQLHKPLQVLLLCLHGGAYTFLIYLQGDGGTAIVFVCIFAVMIFCAGISWKYIAAAAASLVAVVPALWLWVLTDDHKMRFLVILNPERDPNYAYQQLRSAIALGVGGVQGTGIFAEKHVYVPEIYNDFIFAFIGESSGFMGCIGVILLLAAIALKILYNAGKAKDVTGRMICIGLFAMFVSQTIINLGMCLGVLPVIGVTLPFLSSGGTSVLSLYLGLGLALSVYLHSDTGLFSEK